MIIVDVIVVVESAYVVGVNVILVADAVVDDHDVCVVSIAVFLRKDLFGEDEEEEEEEDEDAEQPPAAGGGGGGGGVGGGGGGRYGAAGGGSSDDEDMFGEG